MRAKAKIAVTAAAIAAFAALTGCASTSPTGDDVAASDTPAIATAPTPVSRPMPSPRAAAAASRPQLATKPEDDEPLDRATANGKCWMKVDQNTKLSLEQKAAAVGKCTDDMLAQDRIKRAE